MAHSQQLTVYNVFGAEHVHAGPTELSSEQFAHGAGFSHKEIGRMFNVSDRAVEGRLRRAREKHPDDRHR